MLEQTLFIFCGLPYAGKTTLRNELIKRFKFNYVSVDELIDEKSLNLEKMTQDDWDKVYFEAFENLKKLLTDGKTVILDIGNLKLSQRDDAKAIAQNLGIKHILIYINTPIEKIKRRRKLNTETHKREYLDNRLMNHALNMFKEPTPDENPIFYNQNEDLDEWIKKYLLV